MGGSKILFNWTVISSELAVVNIDLSRLFSEIFACNTDGQTRPVASGVHTVRTNAPFCASALFCLTFFTTQPPFAVLWHVSVSQYKAHCA